MMLRKFRFSLLSLMIFTGFVAIATWWMYSPHTIKISAKEIEEYGKQFPAIKKLPLREEYPNATVRFRTKREFPSENFQQGSIVVDAESIGLWVWKPELETTDKDEFGLYGFHAEKQSMNFFQGGNFETPIVGDEKVVKMIFNFELPPATGVGMVFYLLTDKKRCYACIIGGHMYFIVDFDKYDESKSEIPRSHPAFLDLVQTIQNETQSINVD